MVRVVLFRVLLSFLLFALPAVAEATALAHDAQQVALWSAEMPPPVRPVPAAFAAVSPADVAGPMDPSAGHAMWDPLGRGCIDGGGWSEPFPGAKGAPRSAAFCIPQPCIRALTREELARDVLGRPLREDEWDTYISRYADACRSEAIVPVPDAEPEVERLLTSLRLISTLFDAPLTVQPQSYSLAEVGGAGDVFPQSPLIRPVDHRVPLIPQLWPAGVGSGDVGGAGAPGSGGQGSGSADGATFPTTGGNFGHSPSGPRDDEPNARPEGRDGNPDGKAPQPPRTPVEQPTPVPLPPTMPLLLAAMAVPALFRRRG